MPTLFDETWEDNAGDTVSASDLNSHAGEHSNALFDVEEGGTVIGGVGRDQPINVTGSGASVSKSNGEIVVDVTDTNTDTQVETQAGGTTQYANTSVVNFDTSSDISVTDNGSGKITVAASGGSVDDSGNVLGGTTSGASGLAVHPTAESGIVFEGGTAVGNNTEADKPSATAVGDGAKAKASQATAVGDDCQVNDTAIAIGSDLTANDQVIAIVPNGGGEDVAENASTGIAPYGVDVSAFQAVALGDRGFSGVTVATDNVARIGTHQLVYGANSGGTIADTDLNNQELSLHANGAEDGIVLRYKDSNGTVKTGTVSIS